MEEHIAPVLNAHSGPTIVAFSLSALVLSRLGWIGMKMVCHKVQKIKRYAINPQVVGFEMTAFVARTWKAIFVVMISQ
jgi:predicted tellurium resistance membrane protein TerC